MSDTLSRWSDRLKRRWFFPALWALLFVPHLCCWAEWHGGYCYGPRLIVPLLPLTLLSLTVFPDLVRTVSMRRGTRQATTFLVGASLAMNLAAIVYFRPFWSEFPPFRRFTG